MPTETAPGAALFLFAHQDDEFGVFQAIAASHRRGRRVVCAYLTAGRPERGLNARRERESRRVLGRLGVAADDIVFAGSLLAIDDGSLAERLPALAHWLRGWLAGFPHIDLICMPAWEGGHPDHDALHAGVVQVAREMDLLARLRQFSLYHAEACAAPFFKVLAPLAANGAVEASRIGWRDRLRFLRLCLAYPSQWKTWIGLFPFVALHYALRGVQDLQAVAPARLRQRPHEGALYYEQRRFYTWRQMERQVRALTDNGHPR